MGCGTPTLRGALEDDLRGHRYYRCVRPQQREGATFSLLLRLQPLVIYLCWPSSRFLDGGLPLDFGVLHCSYCSARKIG